MRQRIFMLVLGLLVAVSTQAAVVITVETTELAKKRQTTEIGRISIDGKMMAVEGKDTDGVPQMIFRGDREVLYAINPQRKQYIEVDKATLDQVGGQMDEMMKQMEAKLADMPPQQRAMVERMMRERMPSAAQDSAPMGKPTVKRTDEQKEIAGYACRLYEIHVDDRKVREIWVTPWSNIDPDREAFGIFSELENFFEGLLDAMQTSPFAGMLQNPFDQVSKIDGFPVLTREIEDGSVTRESLFKSVVEQDLPPSAFEPPKGYKKKDIREGMKTR